MLSGLVVLPFTVDHHLLQTHAAMKDKEHCDSEEKAAEQNGHESIWGVLL